MRNYWLDLFTIKTWQEFLDAGGTVSGFRSSRWSTVQKIQPGDYFLCYITGISRWIGILEVVSESYKDNSIIWKDDDFPCRLNVKVVVALTPETGIPVIEMREQLSIFQNLKSPFAWTGHFRGSPAKWKISDAQIVVEAIQLAESDPVQRPFDRARLLKKPKILETKIGTITIPDTDLGSDDVVLPQGPSVHDEIQLLLLKLGIEMDFEVWVARNDRNREVNGICFANLRNMKKELPLQFDEATNRTIEHIDILWLKGNAIVAAFEIESTTSIYSGLLRMSDLIAMQPNLNIPLYIVAPDDRREKVIAEINRPTFSRLSPPMSQMCRFIPFTSLRERIHQLSGYLRYLKIDFLQELSESCDLEG